MFPQLTVLVKVSHRIRVICSSHIQITEDTYRMYKDHPEINFKTYYTHIKIKILLLRYILQIISQMVDSQVLAFLSGIFKDLLLF